MQLRKYYNGSISALGSTRARTYSYGNTRTISQYDNKTDFINQTIADFLHDDCGVDATYEIRQGSTEKFLWIYGVPFLFSENSISGTSLTGINCYGPTIGNISVQSLSYTQRIYIFASPSNVLYNFSLVFAGNPKNGFCLRFSPYNSTSIVANTNLIFVKTKNILNNKDSVVFNYPAQSFTVPGPIKNCYFVDINDDGSPDLVNTSFSYMIGYFPHLLSLPNNLSFDFSDNKFPLVPIMFGYCKANGIYCVPTGFGLPAAQSGTIEVQPEIEIAGRKFIVTSIDGNNGSASNGAIYINLGLIDVTE